MINNYEEFKLFFVISTKFLQVNFSFVLHVHMDNINVFENHIHNLLNMCQITHYWFSNFVNIRETLLNKLLQIWCSCCPQRIVIIKFPLL